MKKILSFVLLILAVLTCCVACSNADDGQNVKSNIALNYGENSDLNKVVSLSADDFSNYKNDIVGNAAVIDWLDADGNSVSFADITDGDTIYAKWGVCVTFQNEEGGKIASYYGIPGEKLVSPSSLIKKGYRFDGWLEITTLSQSDLETFPEFNSTYRPIFNLMNYSVTYDLSGGVCLYELKTSYTIYDEFILPEVTKDNELFCGWFTQNNEKITRISGNAEDLKLTAVFTKTAFYKYLRYDTVTITDSGRANQKFDHIDLNKYVSLSSLLEQGYTSVEIIVTMDVKEINDGYQYCFLYADTSVGGNAYSSSLVGFFDRYILGNNIQKDDPSFLAGCKFEHGPGYKNSNWAEYSLSMTVKTEDLISLGNGNLYIRYGASGHSEDDWQNCHVAIGFNAYRSYN